MKAKTILLVITALTALVLLSAAPVGTAFTYQGRLTDGGALATGIYDLRFTIYDAATNGGLISGVLTNAATPVSNGLFTVTLDFGSGAFNGSARWLQIAARTNGSGVFTPLTPRQPLTPAPYALYAPSAGTAATATTASNVPWAGLTSLPAGFADGVDNDTTYLNGEGLLLTGTTFSLHTDWLQDVLDDRYNERFWSLTGNDYTTPGANFLGTRDNQPLELRVNGQRGLRLEPGGSNSVNVIGGWAGNAVRAGVAGATVAGGGAGDYRGLTPSNRVEAHFGTVSGGAGNAILPNADYGTIAGGDYNTIHSNAISSVIGGGYYNLIQPGCQSATIAGGSGNAIQTNSFYTVIGGGSGNTILSNAAWATVPGGRLNTAGASLTFAAGRRAKAMHPGAFVWADSTDADFASTATNQFAVRANGGVRLETGGTGLYIDREPVFVDRKLVTDPITVKAGPGLSGGGTVNLGETIALTNTGVLSVTGDADITAAPTAGHVVLGTTATSTASPSTLVKRDATAGFAATNLTLKGNLYLPATTNNGGIIYAGGTPLLHAYGYENLFVGEEAGNFTTNGSHNTGSGSWALHANTEGYRNTAYGAAALRSNTNGIHNTAIGTEALYCNTSGEENTANGAEALVFNTAGSRNTASGAAALHENTTGVNNTANGSYALYNNTFGNRNTANGAYALYSNTSGKLNTAAGSSALWNNTSGERNVANGCEALYSNTVGWFNTANGYGALNHNTEGWYNSANGSRALSYNTTGYGNTANGYEALAFSIEGSSNTADGGEALKNLTNGSRNIALGFEAGYYLTNGSGNIHIGNLGNGNENGAIRIGQPGSHTNTLIAGIYGATAVGGVPVYVNSFAKLGTATSSRRFKQDIQDMDRASRVLYALKPVTFRYKPELDPQGIPQFGLVAEEVEKVNPDLVVRDPNGEPYSVRYEQVNAMLLNEFLKEHRKVQDLEKRLERLEQLVQHLAK